MIILAYTLSGLSLLISALFLIKPRVSLLFMLFLPLTAGALSPYWAILGLVGALLGWVYGAPWAVLIGIVGATPMIYYVWGSTRDHKDFDIAFGPSWKDQITPDQARKMVKKRWSFYLKMKASPEPSWERDIPFWTIPGTDRQLLCDIWRPADGKASGLAYIYLHGSAWAVGDKDLYTRTFFHHLAAQGHTVMDIAYRLIPEVDIYGMVGDAKRAVAWMKANADRYGVDPEKIVLGGGSAGGHVALLAGYTPEHPELTPDELKNTDLSVCGLMTYYAPTNLVPGYELYNVKKISKENPPVPIGTKADPKNAFLYAGRLDILLGGSPEEVPDIYRLANPTTHVHSDSPPTLLLQGDVDSLVPIQETRAHYTKLIESGVPAVNLVFPWTQHAFDMMFPKISPQLSQRCTMWTDF